MCVWTVGLDHDIVIFSVQADRQTTVTKTIQLPDDEPQKTPATYSNGKYLYENMSM